MFWRICFEKKGSGVNLNKIKSTAGDKVHNEFCVIASRMLSVKKEKLFTGLQCMQCQNGYTEMFSYEQQSTNLMFYYFTELLHVWKL